MSVLRRGGITRPHEPHCRSYSPLLTRLSTVNPAFLASDTDTGLSILGEWTREMTLRTGFLHKGQCVNGGAFSGRRSSKPLRQATQPPFSQGSYW